MGTDLIETFLFKASLEEMVLTGFVKRELPELVRELPIALLSCSELPGIQVSGISEDSREIKPGFIFVATQGMATDGHRFIPQALAQGAVAIVGTQTLLDLPVPYVQVADARQALAYLSAAFQGYPARRMIVIGVTGTDGKTTTANLIYQILLKAGIPVGIISTVNAMIGNEAYDTGFHVTTPRAPEVQQYMARMLAAGLTHVVLEATSHGLAQHRVTGCEFDIGVLTNITHEHIDNHGSFEAYRDAKASLFTSLASPSRPAKPNGVEPLAVLNRDDSSYEYLHGRISVRQTAYSTSPGADVWADTIHHESDGLHFIANGPGFCVPVYSHLMGLFNVSNCLAALSATVLGLGIDAETASQGIANLRGVPGRMEQISMGQSFIAIVDFAHTPNALKQALKAVREMTNGRVIVVFGSAGLRDREKRRMMAEVSAELADVSILTAEDPRTESLEEILEEMAQGARSKGGIEGQTFLRIPDRGEAIRQAVQMAKPGDLVMACGKGHEQSMCFGTVEYAWDDRIAMRAAVAELIHATGPQMPYLPTREK